MAWRFGGGGNVAFVFVIGVGVWEGLVVEGVEVRG